MLKERYLLLMRRQLIGGIVESEKIIGVKHRVLKLANSLLRRRGLGLFRVKKIDLRDVLLGKDHSGNAMTMIGNHRLANLGYCVDKIIAENIKGDFIECGVWRGGASIYMKAIMAANGDRRTIWVADSFKGLPKPNKKYPEDNGDIHYKQKELAVSLEEVKRNFASFDLLDDRVKFLEGWFKDTLPTAPIEKLALLRIDADMYEGTMDCLVNLYHKVSEGGFVIIDDYALQGCRKAVDDFREKNNITEPIIKIDWTGIYWRKTT